MMVALRSLIFNVVLWVVSIVMIIGLLPFLLLPRRFNFTPIVLTWVFSGLLRLLVGIRYEVKGREHVPEGGFIVASKHQSAWETCMFNLVFPRAAYVLKQELMRVPLLNFYFKKIMSVPMDRRGGKKALKVLLDGSKRVMAHENPLVIFPEGTRGSVGESLPYKRGIYLIYKALQRPVLPVALNSGLYWKRRSFLKYPGKITIQILPPIEPGLDQATFMTRLKEVIETESLRLARNPA